MNINKIIRNQKMQWSYNGTLLSHQWQFLKQRNEYLDSVDLKTTIRAKWVKYRFHNVHLNQTLSMISFQIVIISYSKSKIYSCHISFEFRAGTLSNSTEKGTTSSHDLQSSDISDLWEAIFSSVCVELASRLQCLWPD